MVYKPFFYLRGKMKKWGQFEKIKNGLKNRVSHLFYLGGCIRKKVRNLFKIIFERNKECS
jgi:hypothetical protein